MKHLNLTPDLYDYLLDKSMREHPTLKALREDTASHLLANMQVAPEQAQFMQMLIRLIDAKKVLELGTFTGYSALAMSLALPDEGRIITCDINEEWTQKAPYFWQQANQMHKIKLIHGPALNTLKTLLDEGQAHTFDFIFIDADKTHYVEYYETALQLINRKGLIAIDNVLWNAKVIEDAEVGAQTREIRRLNDRIKNDDRVYPCMLPIADGLFLIQPKNKAL